LEAGQGESSVKELDCWTSIFGRVSSEYVIRQHYVSNHYDRPVAVGDILPGPAEYYSIPPEFRVRGYYRYAIVNDRTVIVDPAIRVVVEVVD
jgi:hypothetical protein